jgi:hypothetical protein
VRAGVACALLLLSRAGQNRTMDVAADSRGVRAAAWSLAGLVLLVLVAALVLLLFNARVMSAGKFGA